MSQTMAELHVDVRPEDDTRKKIQQAKKKLKQFKRSQQHMSHGHSTESLQSSVVESTVSAGSRFVHDEQTSPFHVVPRANPHSTSQSVVEGSVSAIVASSLQPVVADTLEPNSETISESASPTNRNGSASCTSGDDAQMSESEAALRTYVQQLQHQHAELQNQYAYLHSAYTAATSSGGNADSKLTEQIQQQMQTMTVLVQQKCELQAQLRGAMQNCEELRAKHDATMQQVSETEERNNALRREIAEHAVDVARASQHQQAAGSASEKLAKLTQQISELEQEKKELNAKLKQRAEENTRAQTKIELLEREAQMREIYVQQLGGAIVPDGTAEAIETADGGESHVKMLEDSNAKLESQLEQTRKSATHWKNEAEIAQQRYDQYSTRLQSTIDTLTQEITSEQNDKQQLVAKAELLEAERMRLLTELEESRKTAVEEVAVEKAVRDSSSPSPSSPSPSHTAKELEEELAAKNVRLERALVEVHRLEQTVSSMRGELRMAQERSSATHVHAESATALERELHAERTTAARAVEQNTHLKSRLQELEDKFVNMANEEMNAQSRLQSLEHEVSALRDAVSEKEAKIVELQSSSGPPLPPPGGPVRRPSDNDENTSQISHDEVDTHANQVKALDDELKQYQSLYRVVSYELRDTKERVTQLVSENEALKKQRVERETAEQATQHEEEVASETSEIAKRIVQFQAETQNEPETTHTSETLVQHAETPASPVEQDRLLSLQRAMEQLKDRFVAAMTQNADLLDQNQQLEHLVVQLQCETDTIGEYVTIYQHQRKQMKDKLRQREDAIEALQNDKLKMQSRLRELNQLIEDGEPQLLMNGMNGHASEERPDSVSSMKDGARLQKLLHELNQTCAIEHDTTETAKTEITNGVSGPCEMHALAHCPQCIGPVLEI